MRPITTADAKTAKTSTGISTRGMNKVGELKNVILVMLIITVMFLAGYVMGGSQAEFKLNQITRERIANEK